MAARRCGFCGINYPADMQYQLCPVHGEPTRYDSFMQVDDDWQWRATALLRGITPSTHDPDGIITLDIPVTVSPAGYYWISSHDVIRAGIQHRFPPNEVIAVGPSQAKASDEPDGNLYEVIAYVEDRRAYWIRPLLVPDYVPED